MVLLDSVILDIGIEILIAILMIPVSMFIENRYGIINSFKKLYYKIIPHKAQIKIITIYNSTQQFETIRVHCINRFREKYNNIDVKKTTPSSLEFMVNDSFLISVLQNPNNELTLFTNKVKTTTKDIKNDVGIILDVLADFKDDINKSDGNEGVFHEKEFEIFLYLPFNDTYTRVYTPKNVIVKDFEVLFSDLEYDRVITLKADYLNIQTTKRYELEKIIKHFI